MKSQKASSDNASSLLSLKQKEADCIGKGLVDKIGTDQLKKYKLLTKDNKASKDVTAVKMSAGDAEVRHRRALRLHRRPRDDEQGDDQQRPGPGRRCRTA